MWRSTLVGWAAGLLATVPVHAAQDAVPVAVEPGTVSAVWVEHDLKFSYMGVTSRYSCDGLRDKVRWILKELGARPDFRVTAHGCTRPTEPEPFPGVRIVAAMPAAAGADATAPFAARAKQVRFDSKPTSLGELQDGDCELMEQLCDRVFGPLGVKVVAARISCVPRQVAMGSVRVTVEVLEPVPAR